MGNNHYGWSIDKGFYGESKIPHRLKTQPTDLELRIRKEVMELLDETVCDVGLLSIHSDTSTNKLKTIKDRLNLLWSERC